MALSNLQLAVSLRFTLEKLVTGWPSIVQGEDSITATLSGVDLAEWSQAYAAKHALAGAATVTIDLQSFTNLAGEAVVLDKVFAIIVQVTPAVAADDDCEFTIEPGAANGLVWHMADITVKSNETYVMVCDPTNIIGTVVDATHKTLKFTNNGTDALSATVVILGGV